jgi:hypothetical protein
MKTRFFLIIFLIPLIIISPSCKKNPYRVNVSSIDVNFNIKRLENELFTVNPDEITTKIPELKEKYNGFLQLFSYVINGGDVNSKVFSDVLVSFCTDKQNNDVYKLVSQTYPDLKPIELSLSDAFRHYKYYFPEKPVPAVYTCITGFNNSIITGDSVLGIGLERYLGAGCEYYPMLEIYQYMADKMTPENIIPDCIYGWATSEWDFSALGYKADNVLSEIIHEGKLKYFERCMLPETSDELIFGFTTNQLKFCNNNESQMWMYLVEHDLLFNSDQFTIRKLTGEAPFTNFFTNESPGRAAVWLGFRIIESYMKRNPGTSLSAMMLYTDTQEILDKAKYSPQ